MRISGCVIAKNEEKKIGDCLKSLNEVCDEVIVVDTGSNDRTSEIAKEYGAQVYQFEWIDDFSAAKNFAKRKATGDWIVFLDADEYFKEGTLDNSMLKKVIAKRQKKHEAIACTIENLNDDGLVFVTHTVVRIFKNSDNIWFKGKIHENIYKGDEYVKVILATDLFIVHTGYEKEDVDSKNKFERNLKLLEEQRREDPNDARVYIHLGDTYGYIDDKIKQIEYYKKSIEMGNLGFLKTESHYRERKVITTVYNSKMSFTIKEFEMLDICNKYPNDFYFNTLMSGFYYDYGRFRDSINFSSKAIECLDKFPLEELPNLKSYYQSLYQTRGMIFDVYNMKTDAVDNYINTINAYLNSDQFPKAYLIKLIIILKDHQPVEVIELINNLFDTTDIDTLKELLNVFVITSYPVLLGYYIKKYFEITSEKPVYMPYYEFYTGKFEKAIESCKEIYMENYDDEIATLAFAASFLINDFEIMEDMALNFGPSLYKLFRVYAYDESHNINLDEVYNIAVKTSSFGDYEAILHFLDKLPQDQYTAKFYVKFARTLIGNGNDEIAVKLLEGVIGKYELVEQGIMNGVIGKAYFNLNQYQEALNNFKTAFGRLNIAAEIYELILVISELEIDNISDEARTIIENTPHINYLVKYVRSN